MDIKYISVETIGDPGRYSKYIDGMLVGKDGTLIWDIKTEEEKFINHYRYVIKKDIMECYLKTYNKNVKEQPQFNGATEILSDALLIFGDSNQTTDYGVNMDQTQYNVRGLPFHWSYKPKKIKVIEPRKELNKIYIKAFMGHETILTRTPEDFDVVIGLVGSICTKASIGKIIKE